MGSFGLNPCGGVIGVKVGKIQDCLRKTPFVRCHLTSA